MIDYTKLLKQNTSNLQSGNIGFTGTTTKSGADTTVYDSILRSNTASLSGNGLSPYSPNQDLTVQPTYTPAPIQTTPPVSTKLSADGYMMDEDLTSMYSSYDDYLNDRVNSNYAAKAAADKGMTVPEWQTYHQQEQNLNQIRMKAATEQAGIRAAESTLTRLQDQINSLASDNYGAGNINLSSTPAFNNKDGTRSYMTTVTYTDPQTGYQILIPGMAQNMDGTWQTLTYNDAVKQYLQTGKFFGVFQTAEQAQAYANELNNQQRDLFDRRAELSAQFKAGYDMYNNLNNTYKTGVGAQYKDASAAFNKAYDPVAYYLNELGTGANLSSIDNVIEGMDDLLRTMPAGSAEYNATKRQRDALVAGRMSFATDAELQKIYDSKPEYVRDENAKQKANERLAQLVRWGIDPATDQEYQDLLMQGGMKDKNSEERIAAGQELQRRDAVKAVQEAKGTDAEKYLNAFAQYAATGEITAEARKLFAAEENPYANGPATSDAAVLSYMAATLRRKLQESGMDKQRAANVVDALQREGNAIYQRKNDQFYTNLLYGGSGAGDAILDHAIGALSVLENAVSGFGMLEGVRTLLGDQTNKVADPNSLWLTNTRSANKIRGEINQMYGTEVEMLGQKFDLHDFGYNTVMSILDSRLGMIFPKGVMIGAGAAAQSLLESAEAGESIGNSFLLAVATGVNEGLWESLSISGLERFKEKAVITWKDVMTNLLKQGVTNASEEFNTTLANAIFDYFTGSERSNWSRSIAEYMTQINPRTGTTYTREQAKNQVMIDTGKQMLGDAFSGFIQGVAMGTTAQAAALADVSQFKSKYKLVNADVDTIYNMEYGLQFDVGSNTYALCRQAKTEWNAIHDMTDSAQQEEAMKKWLQTYGNSGSSSILNSMAIDVAQGFAPANYTEATHQAYVDAVQRGDSNPLHIESPLETKVRMAQEAAGMSVDAANKTRRIILDILAGRDGSDELGSIRYGNATAEMLTSQAFRNAVEAATGSKVFGNTAREVKQSLADIAKRIANQPAIIEDFTKTEAPESDLVEPTDIPPAQEPPRTVPQNWYNNNANAAADAAAKAPRTTPSGIPLDNLTRNNWYSNGGDSLARNGWYGQTQPGEAAQPGPATERKAEPKAKPTEFEARVKEEGTPGKSEASTILKRSQWYSDGQNENKTPAAEATTPSGIPFADLLRQRSGEEAGKNAPSFELTRNAWYSGEQGETYDEAKAKAEAEEARRKAQNLAPSGVPVSEIGKSWYNTTVPVTEAAAAEAESEASTEPATEQTTEEAPAKEEAKAEEAKTEPETSAAPKSEEAEKEKPKKKQKPKSPIKRLANYLVYGKEKADANEPSMEVVNKQETETGADEATAPKKNTVEIGGEEVTEAEFVKKATAGGDITEETARDAFRRLANDEAIPNDIKESIAEEIEMDRAQKGAKEQGVTEYQYLVQESLNMLLKDKGVSVKFVPRSELPGGNGMVDLTTGEILLSSTGATADTTKMEGIAWTLAHEILHVGEDAEKRAKRSPQEQAQIQTLTDKILGYKSGDEYVPGVLQRLAEIGAIQDKYADLANDSEKLSNYVKDLQNQYRSYYAAKNKSQAWLDENITEDYAREELAGNVFGSLLGVNIFDSYAKDMTGHPFRRVDLLRTLAGIDETPLRAADMSLRERKLAKAIAEVRFGHNMRGKTFRQIYDTTQSEIRSLIKDVTAAVDSRKDAVFEALDDGDIADATRLSYVSLGEAAGFDPVEVDGIRTFVRKDGTPVGEKVTVDDIKASPIGALIAYAREKGYLGKNSEENAVNADKQTQFFADVCTLAAKNNDFAMSMQFVGATTFTGIKANSDKQYGTTYDFKSVCIKTQACIDLMSAAMVAKKGGLTHEEILDLYREANEIGLPVPCPECYVWNRWVGIGGLLDNMWTYQERYGSMSFDEVKAAYDEMHDRVQAKAEEAGLSFGKAKTKMTSQITKDYQNQLDKVAKKMNNGDRVSQADIDKLNALGNTMTDVKALTWIENVYFGGKPMTEQNISKNYRVPADILFDLNRGAEFSTKYANAWAFRTTQGAGYGKAITPYSQATLGEGILGTNSITKMVKAKAAGTLNNPFLNNDGELDKDAKKMLDNAVKKQKIQLFRGGQRFNSTSDASNDVASDYLLAMLEMQSMHGGVQVYTKVDGSVQYLSNVGAFINQSLMPLGSGLDKDGNLRDTTVGGMSPSAAFRNRREYENAGTITIGVNDAHIRELYKHQDRDFVIPYHVSGGDADMVAESRSIQDPQAGEDTRVHSSDYTRTQNEKVLSDEVLRNLGKDDTEIEQIKKNREARIAILTQGKPDMSVVRSNPILSELYDKFNGGQWDGVKLPKGEIEAHIYPNEFWDISVDYDHSGVNTERYLQYCEDLGILHKFSGMVPSNGTLKTIKGYDQYGNRVPLTDLAYQYDENGQRTGEIEDYYWKTLVDRRMYGNQNQYLEQGAIDLTNLGADTIQNFAKYNTGRSYNQALAAQAADAVRERFTSKEETEQKRAEAEAAIRTMEENHDTFIDPVIGEDVKYTRMSLAMEDQDPDAVKPLRDENGDIKYVYKAFYAMDGRLYPPMVSNMSDEEKRRIKGAASGTMRGLDTPMGVWLRADVGTLGRWKKDWTEYEIAFSKIWSGGSEAANAIKAELKADGFPVDGRGSLKRSAFTEEQTRDMEARFEKAFPKLRDASKETLARRGGELVRNERGRLAVENDKGGGTLAFRPGWHSGEWPDAKQFNKDSKLGERTVMPRSLVFARCIISGDVDYQLDAMEYGMTEAGSFERTQAGLPFLPENGYYKYRTNADPTTAPWYISGAIKVVEILDDEQCREICAEYGIVPDPREDFKPINLAEFGLQKGPVTAEPEENWGRYAKSAASIRNDADLQAALSDPNYRNAYRARPVNFDNAEIQKEFERNSQNPDYYREMAKSRPGYENQRLSLAGEMAAKANLKALDKAKEMEAQGKSEDEIFARTHWWKDPFDGEWMFEINDSKAEIYLDANNRMRRDPEFKELTREYHELRKQYRDGKLSGNELAKYEALKKQYQYAEKQNTENFYKKGGKIGDVVKHSALFENYPFLADAPLKFEDLGSTTYGSFNRGNQTLTVNSRVLDQNNKDAAAFRQAFKDYFGPNGLGVFPGDADPSERNVILSIVLHEMQHMIQQAEGFTRGGNYTMSTNAQKNAKRRVQDAKKWAQNVSTMMGIQDLSALYTKLRKSGLKMTDRDGNEIKIAKPDLENLSSINDALKQWMDNDPEIGNLMGWERREVEKALKDLAEADNDLLYVSTASGKAISAQQLYELYRGEQASRNTQERMMMSAADRYKPENRVKLPDVSKDPERVREISIRHSLAVSPEQNAEYMRAAESGDTKTAQRMVDEAAKAAGYTMQVYHGTDAKFNVFNKWRPNYFTPSRNYSEQYGENVKSIYLNPGKIFDTAQNEEARNIYNNEFLPYAVSRGWMTQQEADSHRLDAGEDFDFTTADDLYSFLKRYNRSNGNAFDTMKFFENGSFAVGDPKADIAYIPLDNKLAKLTDPVTYDDEGEIIPLSERFNPQSDDTRYSFAQNQSKYNSREEQIQDIVRRLMNAPTDEHTLWNDSAKSTERMPITKSQINNDSGFRQDREAVNFPKQSENKKVAMRTTQTLANSGLSDARAARMIEEATKDGVWDYIPETNDSATDWAKQEIENKDWDGAYGDYLNSVNKGLSSKKLTALGIQLYNQAIQKQDYYAAMDVASLIIRNAHEAGSALQALNMLGKLNADGKLYMMMKGINNITDYYKKLYPKAKIRIDDALVKAYQKAVQSNDQEAINAAQADIERSVAEQIPATWKDRLNNWRYFSMLANPTTHIRNVFGNLGFAPVRLMKQAMKAGLERRFMGKAGEGSNRTTALLNLAKADDRARIRAGLADAKNVMDLIQSGGKQTGPKDRIEAMRQIALTKALDKVMKANTKALDAEDVLFSAPSYAEALASYLKARGISADDYTNNKISEEDKIAAQKHAIKEAQKATYRDHNAFSDAIANIGSRGRSKQAGVGDKVLTAATEAILPFKRTPANIMARAWEYSPAELVTIMFSDVGKLTRAGAELQAAQEESDGSLDALRRIQKAEAAVADAKSNMFDHISSSAIGSVVLLLGMLARHRGWIMGADDDDDEQAKFDKLRGGQEYSLVDNAGNTYTIDWLAPEILPFFTGVSLYDSLVDRKKGEGGILGDIKEVAMSLYEPMLNMSMLSSLNDMLANQKYVEDNEQISYLAKRVAASYISQFFPTFLGKVENITEDKKYSTYINKESPLGKDEQYNVANILNKIPGNNAEYNQIINYDAWGREQSTGNIMRRLAQNLLSPGYYKENAATPYDDELQRLKDLGFDKVLPYKVSQSQKVDEQYMTAEEYELFTKTMGETQYKLIGQLLKSSGYKKLSNKDKAEAVQEMYSVAKQTATNTILKKRGGKSKEKIKLTSAEKAGMQPATYVIANTVYENAKTPQGYNATAAGNTPTWAKMLAVIDDSSFSSAEKLTFVNAKSTKKEDFKTLDEARKYYEKDKADDKTKPNQKK